MTGVEYEKTLSNTAFHEVIGNKLYETFANKDGDDREAQLLYKGNATSGKTDTNFFTTYDDLNRKASTSLEVNGYNLSGVSDAATKKVVLKSQYTYKDVSQAQTTNQITGISLTNNSGYSKNLNYIYDANGNITNANGITYVYDEANQLTRVNDPVYGTTTYQYDKGGNLVSEKTYAYTTGALQSVVNEKSYYVLYDRLQTVTVNGVTKGNSYDVNGNPINYYNGMTFNWEMGRQLSGITNGSNNISYKYNENGIRTSKTVNGVTTKYTLVDDRITYQTDGTTSMYYRYDSSNSLIGFEYTKGGVTTDYYYVKNLQGDIIGILDKDGNSVVEYSYDAWGKPQSVTGSLASTIGQDNVFRYRGYYYDVETGFYYLQSRYYDAGTCRFINADKPEMMLLSDNIIGTNLYAYCYNNPVNYTDHTGYIAANVVGGIVGGIIGVVGGAFLGNWLADKIGLKGWKRWAFVGGVAVLVGATAAAIGYLVGPYVAKAWGFFKGQLANLLKTSFKSVAKLSSNDLTHIYEVKTLME